ncbi:MAG: DUF1343 domain-containing protein [Bacteroidetes bacterium]|nr:DUF1343 domain-containing protein [Bacteroidota bacterium]
MKKTAIICLAGIFTFLQAFPVFCQETPAPVLTNFESIITGAMKTQDYLSLMEGKQIALVANHTSRVGTYHLIDTLLALGVDIHRIFAPEHGFRGNITAGDHVSNTHDPVTGIPVISLYGRHFKPTRRDMRRIDLVVFDIQDVGVRFYTYISTLSYVMEACAENDVPLIILDRPNPNGFYIDGPVLEKDYASFVGLHPVPVVYGMTIGEYALMVNGEGWLPYGKKCDLKVIPVSGYHHNMICKLPVRPSPNLPDWMSVYLYPSLALFEGTIMSVGRGTDKPFQVFGHPDYLAGSYLFKPVSREGASKPLYEGILCHGHNLSSYALQYASNPHGMNLSWLTESWRYFSGKEEFFNNYFPLLAGTDKLERQVRSGLTPQEIRESWKEDLNRFREIRRKYLLYEDFE